MSSGIYKWVNLENGNTYIGQAKDLGVRHRQFVRFDIHYAGTLINEERIKYPSMEYWQYTILEKCEADELNDREFYYINLYHKDIGDKLLNIRLVPVNKVKTENKINVQKPKIRHSDNEIVEKHTQDIIAYLYNKQNYEECNFLKMLTLQENIIEMPKFYCEVMLGNKIIEYDKNDPYRPINITIPFDVHKIVDNIQMHNIYDNIDRFVSVVENYCQKSQFKLLGGISWNFITKEIKVSTYKLVFDLVKEI